MKLCPNFINHGRPGNWSISAKQGIYCLTALVIRTLACKLDTVLGRILTNTVNEEHFEDKYVGIYTGLAGDEFQKTPTKQRSTATKLYQNVFEQESTILKRLISMDERLLID